MQETVLLFKFKNYFLIIIEQVFLLYKDIWDFKKDF